MPLQPGRQYAVWHLTLPHEPLPLATTFEIDLRNRTARVSVKGLDVPEDDPRRAQASGPVTNGELVAVLVVNRIGSDEAARVQLFSLRRFGDWIEVRPGAPVDRNI